MYSDINSNNNACRGSDLVTLGLQSEWVHQIMVCMTLVRYTIRFNGALSMPFSPSCGLCQGYPLSSYLFLLVADGLSQLISVH
jgi:hypothetical protein